MLEELAHAIEMGETELHPLSRNALLHSVATLLLALLEGTDDEAEARLLRVLDLPRLARVVGHCYRRASDGEASRGEASEAEALLDATFSLFLLARRLIGFHLAAL